MHEDSRVALITGASAGFGRLTALELAREGWRVFGAFRGTGIGYLEAAAHLRAEAEGTRFETVRIDVTDDQSVQGGVESVYERAGRIDALVNVAGFGVHGPWPSISPDQFKAQLETNLVGAYRMCRAVEPIMRAQRRGWIINFSSDAAIRTAFWEVAYSASKYGLEGMSLGMRLESQQFGIRVCVVEPGWYSGTNYDNAMISTVDWDVPTGPYADLVKRMGENQPEVETGKPGAQAVAAKVLELLESDDPPFRSPVGASPARRSDVSDEEYEAAIFDFYSLNEFRGPWAMTAARD